jgi:hypothetical protein
MYGSNACIMALGSKNYLYSGSHAVAERAANFYSLFATCMEHGGVNPYHWLNDVLDKLAYWKLANTDELLPQNLLRQNS